MIPIRRHILCVLQTWAATMLTVFAVPLISAAQLPSPVSEMTANPVERIRYLNEESSRLSRDSTNEALTYAHEAYLLSFQEKDLFWQGFSLLRLSEGYLYNDSYSQSLEYAYQALDIFGKMKNDSGTAETNTMLGWIFYDTDNPGFSLSYHRSAAGLLRKAGNEKRLAASLNAIGLVYQLMNRNDSAYAYFGQSLQLSEKTGMSQMKAAALNNMGISENNLGKYREAISFFEKALSIETPSDDDLRVAEVLNQMAFSFLSLRQYQKTDSLLSAARELINRSPSNTRKEKLMDNLHTFALLYAAMGKYERAYHNLLEYGKVSEEVLSRNKSEVVISQHLKRETREREDKIKELRAQKELRNFQIYALIVGIGLMLIIASLVYSRLKAKREREKKMEAVKRSVIEKELDHMLRQKDDLRSRIEFKNSNLKEFALYEAHNNELINHFLEEAGVILKKNTSDHHVLTEYKKLAKKFLYQYERNRENHGFNRSFYEVQSDFTYNLQQKFPNLTESEQKLCIQIRLNLSSKDIAAANNISVRSVEMARYRLRKRLGLSPGTDLNEFIRTF